MSEIEERLRVIEEKNAALEKRVAEVECFARVVSVAMRAKQTIAEAADDATSVREIKAAAVGVMLDLVLSAVGVETAATLRAAIASEPETMAHDLFDALAKNTGFPAELAKNLRDTADQAREERIKLGELKFA